MTSLWVWSIQTPVPGQHRHRQSKEWTGNVSESANDIRDTATGYVLLWSCEVLL